MTMDETWVHHFQPEKKQQSKHGKHLGFLPSKKAKPVTSTGKVMALFFLECRRSAVGGLPKL